MNKLIVILIIYSTALSAQWVQQSSGTTNIFLKVSFSSPGTGTAVGLAGTIRRTTNSGLNWTSQQSLPNEDLFGVFFANDLTGYICGDGAKIAKTTNGGSNWVNLTAPIEFYSGIFFTDPNTGFICGGGGFIIKTTDAGASWQQLTTGITGALQDLSFANSATGYAAGNGGVIIKTTNGGTNWSSITSPTTNLIASICAAATDIVYIGAEGGVIFKSTNGGSSWNSQTSGTSQRITDLFFVNQNTGSASCLGNAILRTTTGGAVWISQSSSVTGEDFYGVSFPSVNTGYVVGSSGVILFTQTGGFPLPTPPNLLSPLNGATGVSITPLLDWDSVVTAKTYDLQLAADSNFTSPIVDSSFIVQTRLQIGSGLTNNTLYYWRVMSQNAGGTSAWSSIFRFRTIVALPIAPNLLLPPNGAPNVPLTPNFDWDSTSPADFYRIQVSVDTSFSAPQVDITGITQSHLTLTNPQLQNNFRYYWRVAATNQAGTGPWSVVFNFTTVIGPAPPPILLSPPNNSTGVSLTPTLNWIDDISVISYQAQLSNDSTFAATIIDSTGFNVSQLTVRSGLLTNVTSYFWRVRTTNSFGTGPYSVVWKFTTVLAPPVAPTLIDPPNNSNNISTTPTLDWNDVPFAATYRIQVSTDSTFASTLINIGGLTFSQYNVPGATLQNNTRYFWRVNATNSAGTGPFSVIWNFTTVVSPPVAAPVLISPPNGANNLSLTPTLDWNDVFGTLGYRVNLSTDSLFNTLLLDTTITPSQFTIFAGLLSGATTYHWRVRGFNAGGFGPWSVTWRFTTNPVGINIISSEIPKEFKLYNNYPNPFNPVTSIKFDVPYNAFVKIEIFDMLGKKVDELANRYLQAGAYQSTWDASSVASGIYFYRFQTEKYTDIKKMVVVK